MPMGWDTGKASKLNNSKSRASGTGWLVVANEGRAKASVHHDSQSKDGTDSGDGSETACLLGAQSDPLGLLTAGTSEFDSDRRLFRERGGEWEVLSLAGVFWRGDGLGAPKVRSGGGSKRRLRGEGCIGAGSDEDPEQDRFRFREG